MVSRCVRPWIKFTPEYPVNLNTEVCRLISFYFYFYSINKYSIFKVDTAHCFVNSALTRLMPPSHLQVTSNTITRINVGNTQSANQANVATLHIVMFNFLLYIVTMMCLRSV